LFAYADDDAPRYVCYATRCSPAFATILLLPRQDYIAVLPHTATCHSAFYAYALLRYFALMPLLLFDGMLTTPFLITLCRHDIYDYDAALA